MTYLIAAYVAAVLILGGFLVLSLANLRELEKQAKQSLLAADHPGSRR